MAFFDNTNEHDFIGVGVHAFGVQSGDTAFESGHNFHGKLVGAVGYDFKFITATQTLEHIIDDEIGNEDIAKGAKDGIDTVAIDEEGKTDDGRVEVRTLYAAPNGITPPDAKIGEEKLTVSGEYAEGLDRVAKLADVQAFKFLLLDKFEPCFLGVI